MRLVVSWAWKLKGSLLAKGSPRIITASACALIITYHKDSKQDIKQNWQDFDMYKGLGRIQVFREGGSGDPEGPRSPVRSVPDREIEEEGKGKGERAETKGLHENN